MAPYAVSHLKLLYLLEKQGLAGEDSPRLNLYLTNTLELENIELSDLPGISSLSKEARLAGKIKKDTPITVILGNPPYSGHSANRSVIPQTSSKKTGQTGSFASKERTWIGSQIEHYKRIDGIPLQEKNLKWLQDDYVKFIRFAQYMIDRNPAGEGVIGYITNHSYLDNPTFRGMRQSLMTSFNYIYILNLHGNIAKKEKCPDGTVDENLFHIRQGTAIAFFIKKKNHPEPCQVFYGQIQGSRLYKQQLLNSQNIDTTPWQPIQPRAPFYLFTPGENMNQDHYASFFRVNDIFPVHSVAIITARDALTIAPNPDELLQRITQFANLDENTARHTFQLEEDSRDWQIKDAQADLHESGLSPSHITPFLYRPFDIRYTYYTGRSRGFLCMPRPEVMRHMLQENIALITVRQVAEGTFNHCLVTNTITESRITTSNKGIAYLFPLYLYLYPHHHPKRGKNNLFSYLNQNNNQPQPRQPNLSPFILHWWSQTAHFPGEPNPEELFYYVYAILFSNLYRQTYAQGLKMDFPRVPFTTQYPLFCKLSQLGHQLVNLHLLKAPQLNNTSIKFPLPGTNQIKYIQYFPEMQKLLINEQQYFSPIHSTTWEYHLCGYQVLNKWLKDRKKQKLTGSDILHFIKITTIIQLTIQIQNDIDLLYQELEPENFS